MKIGEIARQTGTKVETVRYYEREGLLPAPQRTEGNYRDYGPELLTRLSFIRRARNLGFSMAQVRELLDLSDDSARSCAAVDEIATTNLAEVERKIADLQALRGELSRMLVDCRRNTVGDCRIIDTLVAR